MLNVSEQQNLKAENQAYMTYSKKEKFYSYFIFQHF